MRRSVLAAAASAALLACLGACGGGGGDGSDSDAASGTAPVLPVTAATPAAAADPYAWSDVRYGDYVTAAEQLGIRRDMLRPLAGFSRGLDELCHTAPAQLAEMRKAHLAKMNDTDTFSAAQYMQDEVALRIGLACPQRMTDWTATGTGEDGATGGSESDGSEASVTDEDLARATAEEQAARDWDPAGYEDTSDDSADDTADDTADDSADDSADDTVDAVAAPTEDPSE